MRYSSFRPESVFWSGRSSNIRSSIQRSSSCSLRGVEHGERLRARRPERRRDARLVVDLDQELAPALLHEAMGRGAGIDLHARLGIDGDADQAERIERLLDRPERLVVVRLPERGLDGSRERLSQELQRFLQAPDMDAQRLELRFGHDGKPVAVLGAEREHRQQQHHSLVPLYLPYPYDRKRLDDVGAPKGRLPGPQANLKRKPQAAIGR